MDIAKIKSVLAKANVESTASDEAISSALLAASFTPTEVDTALVLLSMPDPNAPATAKPKESTLASNSNSEEKKVTPKKAPTQQVVVETAEPDELDEPSFFGKLVESVADVKLARGDEAQIVATSQSVVSEHLLQSHNHVDDNDKLSEAVATLSNEVVTTDEPVIPSPAQQIIATTVQPTHPAVAAATITSTFKKLTSLGHRTDPSAKTGKRFGFTFAPAAIKKTTPSVSKTAVAQPAKPLPNRVKPTFTANATKARPLYTKLNPVAATVANGPSKLFYSSNSLSAQEIHKLLGIDVRLDAIEERRALGDRNFAGWQFVLVWLFAAVFAIAGIGYYMYIEEIGIFHETVSSTPFDAYLPDR